MRSPLFSQMWSFLLCRLSHAHFLETDIEIAPKFQSHILNLKLNLKPLRNVNCIIKQFPCKRGSQITL